MNAHTRQFDEEFVGVFAPAMPPHGWELLIAELDKWTLKQIAITDEKLRGHCQDVDCYELADLSDMRTSLAYCAQHFIDMRMRQIDENNLRALAELDRMKRAGEWTGSL